MTTAIAAATSTARRGLPLPGSTAANHDKPGNNLSLASACRMRGAPRNDASADDSGAAKTPAVITTGQAATRHIASLSPISSEPGAAPANNTAMTT